MKQQLAFLFKTFGLKNGFKTFVLIFLKHQLTFFKHIYRKASHEEDTLDDIFNVSSKSPFAATEDDDDLFKNLGPSQVADMNVDDISQYIQQNLGDNTKENLKLFQKKISYKSKI